MKNWRLGKRVGYGMEGGKRRAEGFSKAFLPVCIGGASCTPLSVSSHRSARRRPAAPHIYQNQSHFLSLSPSTTDSLLPLSFRLSLNHSVFLSLSHQSVQCPVGSDWQHSPSIWILCLLIIGQVSTPGGCVRAGVLVCVAVLVWLC